MIGFRFIVIIILSVIVFLGNGGLGGSAYAQDYQLDIRQLGVKEGLLHREVNAIHQDSKGFLWFATPLGLNRYDGYRFKYFTQKTHQFQTNRFEFISEDQAGRLWLFGLDPRLNSGNIVSIDILGAQADSAYTFNELFPDHALFEVKDLRAICIDGQNGELVFQSSMSSTVYFYDVEEGFREITLEEFPDFELKLIDPKGNFWGQAAESDWVNITPDGKLLRRVSFEEKYGSTSKAEVHSAGFYVYSVSLPLCLKYIDWEGNVEKIDLAAPDAPLMRMPRWQFLSASFLADKTSEDQGQYHPDTWNQLISHFGELEGNFFRSYLKTTQNEMWVGGNFGVYQIQLRINPFTNYLAESYLESKRGGHIACRGLAIEGDLIVINQEPYNTHLVDLNTGKSSILDIQTANRVGNWAVHFYDEDVFLGKSSEFFRTDLNGKLVDRWDDIEEVEIIFEEHEEHLWLGMGKEKGIAWFNPRTGAYSQSKDNPILAPLLGQSITHISADRAGRVWICADEGLYQFDAQDSIFHYYGRAASGENFLPIKNVFHLYQDEEGIIWIATRGDGLMRWDKKNGAYLQFMREDGLPNNTLYAIYEDDHNHLWIPSDYGIIQFDKITYKSKTYLPEDGTSEVEYNRLSHTRAADGRLYFGSLNGVTSFHPDDFYTKETGSQARYDLRIAGFSQFDSEKNRLVDKTTELATTGVICMMPEDRYINLQLALLNFGETGLNQYLWRLEGWSDSWQVQTQPEIQLSKLPYGQYDLEIKARTAKGDFAANEIKLKVEVVPPFYRTKAFLGVLILSILGLAGLILLLRLRQLSRMREKLEHKVKEATRELRELDSIKMRLFANVSHELRTPLTLILGPISSVLKRKKIDEKDKELLNLALENGQGLEHLITEILDLGKLESGKLVLNESPINLSIFIQKAAASFHAAAENQGIQFQFESQIPDGTFLRCDRHLVEKVLNNLLSNAVKFTPENGSVRFAVSGAPHDSLEFEVSDTGRGIHEDDLPYIFDRYYQAKKGGDQLTGGTGIGLALSKELAALMGGSLMVTSDLGKGSTFVFRIPWKANRIVTQVETPSPALPIEAIEIESPIAPLQSADKASILVTEDNADLRKYLKSFLEPHYHVTLARHGKEALQILEKSLADGQTSIDILISDLMMPEMDGFTLLETLRKKNEFTTIPVIMLTARTGISDRLRALRLGVHDYLTKPFQEEELLARIENLIKWSRERKAELSEENLSKSPVFSHEETWLREVEEWVSEYFQSTEIKVIDWAISLNLSESQLRRKLKQATGLTPQQYLQEYRLKEARKLLENQVVSTVAEAAYEVGFSAADYFSKVFQKRFGKRPSQYLAA